jgi:hypothetical protein
MDGSRKETTVKIPQLFRIAGGAVIALGVIALAGIINTEHRVQAQDNGNDEEQIVHIGYAIAPVPLNLEGRNRDLVGLGSFIVNAQADCNGCHTAGGAPNFNYANNGNPYFLKQPQERKQTPVLTWPVAHHSVRLCPQVPPWEDFSPVPYHPLIRQTDIPSIPQPDSRMPVQSLSPAT